MRTLNILQHRIKVTKPAIRDWGAATCDQGLNRTQAAALALPPRTLTGSMLSRVAELIIPTLQLRAEPRSPVVGWQCWAHSCSSDCRGKSRKDFLFFLNFGIDFKLFQFLALGVTGEKFWFQLWIQGFEVSSKVLLSQIQPTRILSCVLVLKVFACTCIWLKVFQSGAWYLL